MDDLPPTAPLAELRKVPTSGRWVLALNRTPRTNGDGSCPFCPGNEARTPAEIAAYRSNGQPRNSSEWLVRVIPERAPLLQIEGDIHREGIGVFDSVSSRGASELVIERRDHKAAWETLPAEDVERVIWMCRERVADLYRDAKIRAILVLRREWTGVEAINHPFTRILGAPIIFDDLRQELATARHHYGYKERCLFCDILQQEERDGRRVVEQTASFLVFAPYASCRPFETWVVPTTHCHRFELISPPEIAELARTLQSTFRRLHAVQPGHPLELTLHTAPNEAMRLRDDEWLTLPEDFHWHIEIAPDAPGRQSLGGFAVNSVQPERAARQLRDAIRT